MAPACIDSHVHAYRFRQLPAWVHLFSTGRPEVQELFDEGWRQEWINPQDMQNSNDLQVLLERSLALERYVAEADRAAATQVLLRKSEVGGLGGLYLKFVA